MNSLPWRKKILPYSLFIAVCTTAIVYSLWTSGYFAEIPKNSERSDTTPVSGSEKAPFPWRDYLIDKTDQTDTPDAPYRLPTEDSVGTKYAGTGYSRVDNWISYYGTQLEGTDAETFEILDSSIPLARDKNNVYARSTVLAGVDPETFEILGWGYFKDKNGVYGSRPDEPAVYSFGAISADSASFEVLKNGYAKDKNSIFFANYAGAKELPLPLDASTFEVVVGHVVRDGALVFFKDDYADSYREAVGVDAASFEYVGVCAWYEGSDGGYYKDKDYVYVENYGAEGNRVSPFLPAKSFTYLGTSTVSDMGGTSYATDGKNVYTDCTEILDDADPATFVRFDNGYAKDTDTVWYDNRILSGADPNTFTSIEGSVYVKDKNSVWRYGETLPDADPATFVALNEYYGKDAQHVYSHREIIEGADPATFQLITDMRLNEGPGAAQDKNYRYSYGQRIDSPVLLVP